MIIEEEPEETNNKNNYKHIYQSRVRNISAYGRGDQEAFQGEDQFQRTVSFHEKLNGNEFKKDQSKLM